MTALGGNFALNEVNPGAELLVFLLELHTDNRAFLLVKEETESMYILHFIPTRRHKGEGKALWKPPNISQKGNTFPPAIPLHYATVCYRITK